MNKPQRDVILTGLIVIAVMALFPPWVNETYQSGGYGFVFYAPYYGVTVNLARLAAQVLSVISACAALYLYLNRDS